MDWSKAKTILIIALIITNTFLLGNYLRGSRDTGEIDNTETLVAMLNDNGISVSEIPKEHKSVPSLTVRYETPTKEEVEALLESAGITADVSGRAGDKEKAYTEAAEDFVSYLGMMSEYAEPRYYEENGEAVVEFECLRNDYKVDGSFMRCTFAGEMLSGFESYWLEPVEFSNRKLSTISASVALISFMTERGDGEPVTVENVEMVYWIDAEMFDPDTMVEDTALPAWKLTLSGGEAVYIDAIER